MDVPLETAKSFDLTAASDLRDIDFRLHSAAHFSLSDRLMDAGTRGPAGAAFVRAYYADPVLRTFLDGTVREGRFQIRGMKPGRYFLEFDWLGPTNTTLEEVGFGTFIGNISILGQKAI